MPFGFDNWEEDLKDGRMLFESKNGDGRNDQEIIIRMRVPGALSQEIFRRFSDHVNTAIAVYGRDLSMLEISMAASSEQAIQD